MHDTISSDLLSASIIAIRDCLGAKAGESILVVTDEPGQDVIALDDALAALAKFDERKSRVVELRFFGGLSVEETASVLDVSRDTVLRDWRLARAWLRAEIRGDHPG